MSRTQDITPNQGPTVETACPASADIRGPGEAVWQVDAGHDGAGRSSQSSTQSACVREEGVLPIAIRARDGSRVIRAVRSRWSRAGRGCAEGIEVLCRGCSAPLEVRDLPLRTLGMFACSLSCPRCSRGMVACGSRRTLYLALRLTIDGTGVGAGGWPDSDRPRPGVVAPTPA